MGQAKLVVGIDYARPVEAVQIIKLLATQRQKRGIKQSAVAATLGVTQQAISHLETKGAREVPWATLRAYATAIGCELVVELVEAGAKAEVIDAAIGLPGDRANMAARYLRLLGVLEPRDLRLKLADLEILEEEYGLAPRSPSSLQSV